MKMRVLLLVALVVALVAASTVLAQTASNATTPATTPSNTITPPAVDASTSGNSTCVRCDTAHTGPCPSCKDDEVCVYVARTCGQCARKECRPAQAVGASLSAPTQVNSSASQSTIYIIIGCCAVGAIALLAGVGLLYRRRHNRLSSMIDDDAHSSTRGASPHSAAGKLNSRISCATAAGANTASNGLVGDDDEFDELGIDPLGAQVRIKPSLERSNQSMSNIASVFEPPMMAVTQPPWRRSAASSIYSGSPMSLQNGSVLSDAVGSLSRPESALTPAAGVKPKKSGGQLRIDTSLAAGGARSKDSLERARNATKDLADVSTQKAAASPERLLKTPAPAEDLYMQQPSMLANGSSQALPSLEALLPPVSPSIARFSMASFTSALDNGKGIRPLSTVAPLSPVPAHPPPTLPKTAVTTAASTDDGDAQRVDEWWRASVNARSTVYDELGRPLSLAYSDVSSNADSVVQVASARLLGASVHPTVAPIQQVRGSRMLLGQVAGPRDASSPALGANSAQNAYLALSARRAEAADHGADAGADPPTGSVYGMM